MILFFAIFQVQDACQDFPNIVGKIIEFNGFESEKFDNLYSKANSNLIFNMRVKQEIEKIKREDQSRIY